MTHTEQILKVLEALNQNIVPMIDGDISDRTAAQYEFAEQIVKLWNLHIVSKRSELLIGLLEMLEKDGGNEFIDKAEIVAKYEANL